MGRVGIFTTATYLFHIRLILLIHQPMVQREPSAALVQKSPTLQSCDAVKTPSGSGFLKCCWVMMQPQALSLLQLVCEASMCFTLCVVISATEMF